MNINQYVNAILRVWDSGDGFAIGRLLSLKDYHIRNSDFYLEDVDRIVQRQVPSPLDEMVSAHLRVLFYLSSRSELIQFFGFPNLSFPFDIKFPFLDLNYSEAFKYQTALIQSVVKLLKVCKEENWPLPIMYAVCLDLRLLAMKCEKIIGVSKPGEILEKAAESLMICFRVCAADSRSSDEDTKRHGMMNLVNQMLKVYFKINKLHLCKPLIRAIESSAYKDQFPLHEQVTYKYFIGRKAMYDSDYKSANEFLGFAFRNCPDQCQKNKRMILIYLIPVKMLLGIMPRRETLEKYDLLQFLNLIEALKQGNVRKLDDVIESQQRFFIDTGIYLIVEKLKMIAYRNLFKRVWMIGKTHQIDLNLFMEALKFVGEEDITLEETHCIVATLIYESRIKGYISLQHNKLVVSKQNPFPPLNTTVT